MESELLHRFRGARLRGGVSPLYRGPEHAVSTVLRNYRYRIYPRAAEQTALGEVLRLHREVYNAALQERRDAWRKCGVSVSYNMQSAQIKEIRAIREDVGELNFGILNFFRLCLLYT